MTISPRTLLAAIRKGESSTLELKELLYRGNQVTNPDRGSVADELAALANSQGGLLVLGVNDKTCSAVGIPTDMLTVVQNWLMEIYSDLIQPRLDCTAEIVEVVSESGTPVNLLVVDIKPGNVVYLSPGGYYCRIGNSKRKMNPDVLARLMVARSPANVVQFDEQAVISAPEDSICKSLWAKFRTERSPVDDTECLLKLGILTRDEAGQLRSTVGGLLLATKDPQQFMRNAFIQAAVYRGNRRDSNYHIDSADIHGPLDEQIAGACGFVNRNMRTYAIKHMAREEVPQYSMRAVFEAIVNAVAHRDYSVRGSAIRLHMFSNRIELFSPGNLINKLTVDNIEFRQKSRNSLITSLLSRCPVPMSNYSDHRAFLMDKRGDGVAIIIGDSKRVSGREPEYRLLDDEELMLTIYGAPAPGGDG